MKVIGGIIILLLLGAGAGFLFMVMGVYNVAATDQHTKPVYWLVENGMKYSVRRRAEKINPPILTDAALLERGFYLYREHCVKCHGAPGVAPDDFAQGMTPVPLNLVEVARLWRPEELYWATKYGLKMTGMPAWAFRFSEYELWAVVAFMRQLTALSPQQYQMMNRTAHRASPLERRTEQVRASAKLGDEKRGVVAIRQYACYSCHTIPGVVGADKVAGPPLEGIASRMYIAGMLSNTSENMLRWIQRPQELNPLTAMPDMRVTEKDARDIAAYLSTLK
jgi:mono/diheme cytochrome c family protein